MEVALTLAWILCVVLVVFFLIPVFLALGMEWKTGNRNPWEKR